MGLSNFVKLLSLAFLLVTVAASPAPEITPPPELRLNKRTCAADNCLRALRNRISTAVPFCEAYTTATTTTVPTWATAQCTSDPTRVSSACACLATATLTKVYGPTDGTNYTIYSQAVNIRSDPGDPSDPTGSYNTYFTNCFNECTYLGSQCQTFSFAQMANNDGSPGGLYLCYIYETAYQPAYIASAPGWTGNEVWVRGS